LRLDSKIFTAATFVMSMLFVEKTLCFSRVSKQDLVGQNIALYPQDEESGTWEDCHSPKEYVS
jgi:hypothetical protein